jgi:hypothetical protein
MLFDWLTGYCYSFLKMLSNRGLYKNQAFEISEKCAENQVIIQPMCLIVENVLLKQKIIPCAD